MVPDAVVAEHVAHGDGFTHGIAPDDECSVLLVDHPIQKVASGGELARIMLALKNVLAEGDQIGTLFFDEVDTGVSGRAAQKVAEKMAQVARGKQVLCVTHLPQIAAMADTHFSVQKGEREGRTYTRLERLDRSQRREDRKSVV